jgi:PAT family beta-lactamase induction signal transducer AmpG
MGVPRVLASAPTGWMAEGLGWPAYFLLCALIAVPGLIMLRWMQRLMPAQADDSQAGVR